MEEPLLDEICEIMVSSRAGSEALGHCPLESVRADKVFQDSNWLQIQVTLGKCDSIIGHESEREFGALHHLVRQSLNSFGPIPFLVLHKQKLHPENGKQLLPVSLVKCFHLLKVAFKTADGHL